MRRDERVVWIAEPSGLEFTSKEDCHLSEIQQELESQGIPIRQAHQIAKRLLLRYQMVQHPHWKPPAPDKTERPQFQTLSDVLLFSKELPPGVHVREAGCEEPKP